MLMKLLWPFPSHPFIPSHVTCLADGWLPCCTIPPLFKKDCLGQRENATVAMLQMRYCMMYLAVPLAQITCNIFLATLYPWSRGFFLLCCTSPCKNGDNHICFSSQIRNLSLNIINKVPMWFYFLINYKLLYVLSQSLELGWNAGWRAETES